MCDGIRFIDYQQQSSPHALVEILFADPDAELPILDHNGLVSWQKWGCHHAVQDADFIAGGWVNKSSLESGRWSRFHPHIVHLAVVAYMEEDDKRQAHWFDVPAGHALQAVIVRVGQQARAYVVTTQSPHEFSWASQRWPMVVSLDQPT